MRKGGWKKERKEEENYLDRVFCHAESMEWNCDDSGRITLIVENKGFFNRAAQKLLNKPAKTQVHLDEFGNFIWMHLDGTRSVYEIAVELKEKFGEKAEPLYERLIMYMERLREQGFIQQNIE